MWIRAAVGALVLPLLFVADGMMQGDEIDAGTWLLGLQALVFTAGILFLPWLVQRHRRPGEDAALT